MKIILKGDLLIEHLIDGIEGVIIEIILISLFYLILFIIFRWKEVSLINSFIKKLDSFLERKRIDYELRTIEKKSEKILMKEYYKLISKKKANSPNIEERILGYRELYEIGQSTPKKTFDELKKHFYKESKLEGEFMLIALLKRLVDKIK